MRFATILTMMVALFISAVHADWPMAGANPERTSWAPDEARGFLNPRWIIPIEPYVSHKVQVVATNGVVYVPTAKGLYAFDAENGMQKWVYPTESRPTANGRQATFHGPISAWRI